MGLGLPEIIILLFILAMAVVPAVFFLLTLQNTLKEVSIENRKMEPGMVWLMFIPLFGMVWQFIIVNRLADSLRDEFVKKNVRTSEARPGFAIGLTFCILFCCSIIPYLGLLTSIAGLVFWIIYWVKINGYREKLKQSVSADF